MFWEVQKNDIDFPTSDAKTGKLSVYLVADKKQVKYAYKLQTLISTRNYVKSVIYDLNVYKANQHKTSSDNLIIFIGENDISSAAVPNVNNQAQLQQLGLFYTWLGTRAKISVSMPALKRDKITELFRYINPTLIAYEKLWYKTKFEKFQYNAVIMDFVDNGLDKFIGATKNE